MVEVVPRRLHYGGATPTALNAPFRRTDMSFTIKNDTGWPSDHTAVGTFIVTIDRGTTREERVLCDRITGTTVTVAVNGRGYDGTTPIDHPENSTVEHTFSAIEADELNLHLLATSGVHGASGKIMGASDVTALLGVTDLIPPGMLMPYAGTNIPHGWLLCDGREVPKTRFPLLYAAIGDRYSGASNPPNDPANFRLPTFNGRTFVGASTPNGTPEGSATAHVTLTVENLPPHVHTTPALTHSVTESGAGGHDHSGTTAGATARHTHAISDHTHTSSAMTSVSLNPSKVQQASGTGMNGSLVTGQNTGVGTSGANPPVGSGHDSPDHAHTFTTGGVVNHAHSVAVADHAAGTTGPGVGASEPLTISTMQPHYKVPILIKCDAGVTP